MATIATHSGNVVALGHNQRRPEYVAGESHIRADGYHTCWEAKKWNLVSETSEMWTDEAEIYGRLFGRACADYAEKCKERGHPERAKTPQDVLDAQKRNGRPAIRELVCGVYPADGEEISEKKAESILVDFAGRFMDKFPSMLVLGLYFHADEQGKSPHMHIDYVPVARRKSRGLSVSPSMSGALREMGYSDKVDGKTVRAHALTSWTADVNKLLEDVCLEHGVTVTHPDRDKDVRHLDTAAYKAMQDAQKAAEAHAREIETDAERATRDAQKAAEAKAREIARDAEEKAAKRLSEAEKQRRKALSDVQRRQDAVDSRKRLVEERERIADERVQRGVDEGFQDAVTTARRHTDEAHAIAAAKLSMRYIRETRGDDDELVRASYMVEDALDDVAYDERGMSSFKQWWHDHLARYRQFVQDVLATIVETVTGYKPRQLATGAPDNGVDGGMSRGDGEPSPW